MPVIMDYCYKLLKIGPFESLVPRQSLLQCNLSNQVTKEK